MENIVYCNNCFRQSSRTLMFHVTSCGYISCKTCKDECTLDTCKMCHDPCSTAALSNNMAPEVRKLFKDAHRNLRRASMTSEFQKIHSWSGFASTRSKSWLA